MEQSPWARTHQRISGLVEGKWTAAGTTELPSDLPFGELTAHPKLTWGGAQEPDVLDSGKYRIWRRILYQGIEPWELHDSVTGTATQYIDYSVSYAGSGMYTARYKVRAVDFADLESAFSDSGQVQFGDVWKTGEQDSSATIPVIFELNQNYPNPFNPSTTISYVVGTRHAVSLRVFDVLGREVATLVNEIKPPGVYAVQFDGSNLPSGVYFYRLTAGGFTRVRKMVLIR